MKNCSLKCVSNNLTNLTLEFMKKCDLCTFYLKYGQESESRAIVFYCVSKFPFVWIVLSPNFNSLITFLHSTSNHKDQLDKGQVTEILLNKSGKYQKSNVFLFATIWVENVAWLSQLLFFFQHFFIGMLSEKYEFRLDHLALYIETQKIDDT